MSRRTIYALIAMAMAVAITTGVLIVMAESSENNSNNTSTVITPSTQYITEKIPGKRHRLSWFGKGPWAKGMVEISPEYNATVLEILRANTNTSELLEEGYSVIAIKPIIRAYVLGDGSVVLKATKSIVALSNGNTTITVLVDIANNTAEVLSETTNCYCPCIPVKST